VSPPPSVPGVEHAWIEANGVRLHVADTGGDKPPVLLLHGWPQHWWEWRDVIPLLAPHHRVIAPDLRGFGWSDEPGDGYRKDAMAADVVALLDALGIEQVDLVAHDWGGWVGFLLCLDHPERIRRYLATNTAHPLAARDPRLALQFWRLWYQVAIFCGLALRPRVNGWLGPDAWSPQEREMFLGPLSTPAGRRLSAEVYGTFLRHELPLVLAGSRLGQRLRHRTVWLHGADDRILVPPLVESLRASADELEIEYVEGVGHFIVDARPELVAERAIRLFAA
jgi:pimeloyl-ACP methyl ester carboxylesterase